MRRLIFRSLTCYWRTNAAVVLGIATAVAVLGGALLIGDSVRGSLRDLLVARLGRTDHVVVSPGFFRERLADEVGSAVPLIALPGMVTAQDSGRRIGQVRVYGVDARFWQFHGLPPQGPANGDVLVSPAIAEELGGAPRSTMLVRVQRPSDIPLESIQGRKDDLGRILRLAVRATLPASALGEFSLEPQQADVRAVFVPLEQLQRELDVEGRVNTILVSGGEQAEIERRIRARATLADVGLTLNAVAGKAALVVGSDAGLLSAAQADAAFKAIDATGARGVPILTYLANTLRRGTRDIPYSLVTAIDLHAVAPGKALAEAGAEPSIVLNSWAAAQLEARPGDSVSMEYYVWEEPGRLVTRSAAFRVAALVPIQAGDRDLAPAYPGITDSPSLSDWDPPFPIDLRRVRPVDEAYWERYRTTPKAFIPLEVGQRMWRSRYGALTSIRIPAGSSLDDAKRGYEQRLQADLDPLALGFAVRDVRAQGLAASRGATDFGAYFVYFSFFIVVSAILLASLFFRLGVEQRVREIGVLRAVGFGPVSVRRLFLIEGLALAVTGSLAGVPLAIGYAALLMAALRTWWVDAVGTDALTLHVAIVPLLAAAGGGIAAAFASVWWTLRRLTRISERSLLAGEIDEPHSPKPKAQGGVAFAAALLALAGVSLLAAANAGLVGETAGFFGAGSALLVAALCGCAAWLRHPSRRGIDGGGRNPLSRLGWRNATYRPARSVVAIAVIASATFILISVDAFRRDARAASTDVRSGLGGYSVLVETLLPVVHDPNTVDGRRALNLTDARDLTIEPFRLLPGDDASCLNLYEPVNPRILAPRDSFIAGGRFAFQDSLASTDAERANPWVLLKRSEPDGAIPVIADANSMTYVLHRRLGDVIQITRGSRQIRLRLVAALRDSIFQSGLLMSQARFLELFPEEEGYRFLLVEAAPSRAADTAAMFEAALADLGADATLTAQRLAQFHRVENSYLLAFQTLGGLGLLLGTVGLATVLLRNALERRRELALLGAVGYRRRHFLWMAAAENALLLAAGLAAGAICAGLAIAPAIAERGGHVPFTTGGMLLVFAVFVTGLLSSLVAAGTATRTPLLDALRSE